MVLARHDASSQSPKPVAESFPVRKTPQRRTTPLLPDAIPQGARAQSPLNTGLILYVLLSQQNGELGANKLPTLRGMDHTHTSKRSYSHILTFYHFIFSM
jgi:hypothetical protein